MSEPVVEWTADQARRHAAGCMGLIALYVVLFVGGIVGLAFLFAL